MTVEAPLRVCVLTLCASRLAGGLFYSVRELSRAMSELPGCSVSVWCVEDEKTSADLPAWKGLDVTVFARSGSSKFGFSWAMLQAIGRADFDLVHVHGVWNFSTVAARAFQRRGIPVVVSPRGMYDPWIFSRNKLFKQIYFRLVERPLLARVRFVHALNETESDAVRALGPHPVVIAPNGVRCPDAVPARQRTAEVRTLAYVGRLHEKKGLVEFLEAFARIDEGRRSHWRLKIHGWGDAAYVARLSDTVHRLRLADRVSLEGEAYGDRKTAALTEADAFVLPTKSEGLPMAVLEAWSFGLPALLTDQANLPIGFSSGAAMRLGQLPDWPRDIEAFFSQVELDDDAMGRKARALVEAEFRWQAIAARLLAHYRAEHGAH